jgi:hypothetical protein
MVPVDGMQWSRPFRLIALKSTRRPVQSMKVTPERSTTIRGTSVFSASRITASSWSADAGPSAPESAMATESPSRRALIKSGLGSGAAEPRSGSSTGVLLELERRNPSRPLHRRSVLPDTASQVHPRTSDVDHATRWGIKGGSPVTISLSANRRALRRPPAGEPPGHALDSSSARRGLANPRRRHADRRQALPMRGPGARPRSRRRGPVRLLWPSAGRSGSARRGEPAEISPYAVEAARDN